MFYKQTLSALLNFINRTLLILKYINSDIRRTHFVLLFKAIKHNYSLFYRDLPHTKQLHRTVQNNVSLLLQYSSMVYPTQSNQHIFAQFFYF